MLIIFLCIMLLGSFATSSIYAAEPVEKVYFSIRDRRGDDYGSGNLRYPTDPLFVPGIFDLSRFAWALSLIKYGLISPFEK